MNPIRRWLVDRLVGDKPVQYVYQESTEAARARPGQSLDAQNHPYGAFAPEMAQFGNFYAISPWVNMAVARMVAAAGAARLRVHDRNDLAVENGNHGLLKLIGPYGMANDSEDHLEFLESHLTSDYMFGNVYWYWWNGNYNFAGAPTQVYQLDPEKVRVVPGSGRSVAEYIYRFMGEEFHLSPVEVTHFKRPNPYSPYYGLSPFVALYVDVTADRAMSYWNRDFFGDGVAMPAGMLVVPESTPPDEIKRIEYELSAKYGEQRKTAVVKAAPGAAAWFDAGAKHHDYDFLQGRELARMQVFDATGLPRGLLSENSTEANSRVAERQLYSNVQQRLMRVTARLNADAMGFWPGSMRWAAQYPDPRMQFADWDQELKRMQALGPITSVNERRSVYSLPAMPGHDDVQSVNLDPAGEPGNSFSDNGGGNAESNGESEAGRDNHAVQSEGQA